MIEHCLPLLLYSFLYDENCVLAIKLLGQMALVLSLERLLQYPDVECC